MRFAMRISLAFGVLMLVGKMTAYFITGHRETDDRPATGELGSGFGVVAGLALVLLTRWKPFDPLVAIAVAINILWAGGHLVWRSAVGLLDHSDPSVGKEIRGKLDAICGEVGLQYHRVRCRTTGYRQIIEVHLLFPHSMAVGDAHRLATLLEERLPQELIVPAEVFTHLESL
jgi:divalent metal cation (Fe/Co/Zn/Cd) transporter